MEQRRKHYFPENDCTVITGLCPNGEYGATREDEDEGLIRGYGHSRMAAIADLVEAIDGDDEEEIDPRAARFDHAQDNRKNWVA